MLLENQILQRLSYSFERSPAQANKFLTSDSEIINIDDRTSIAITVDFIVEEITLGLYSDPYLIGWMAVMSSISDLTASGAKPLGVLLIEDLPGNLSEEDLSKVQTGISDACKVSSSYVLGGDTNFGKDLRVGSVGLGTFPNGNVLSRLGANPGDYLFISNKMGKGMAFAFAKFFHSETSINFLPTPNPELGQILGKYASSCIDTSDGFFPALCNLQECNQIGFNINKPIQDIIDPIAMELSTKAKLPQWTFLAGPHGEFELIFTIPGAKKSEFLNSVNSFGFYPEEIGNVIDGSSTNVLINNENMDIDIFEIANAWMKSESNPRAYLERLLSIDNKIYKK